MLNLRKPTYRPDTLPEYCKYFHDMLCIIAKKLADRFFWCGQVYNKRPHTQEETVSCTFLHCYSLAVK